MLEITKRIGHIYIQKRINKSKRKWISVSKKGGYIQKILIKCFFLVGYIQKGVEYM